MVTNRQNKDHSMFQGRTLKIQRYEKYLEILRLHFIEKRKVPYICQKLKVKKDFVRESLIGEGKTYKQRYLKEGNIFNISEFKIKYFSRGRTHVER